MTQMLVVTKPSKVQMSLYIIFGIISVTFGFLIYYVFPATFLAFDFTGMTRVSLLILISLVFGLCLLAYNLQYFVELVILELYTAMEP